MQHVLIDPAEWQAYPSRAYANWFSQLEGMRSPVLVGTQAKGQPNLAIFNSLTHIGARPPLLGLVFRPLTVERHSYENIKASGFYTINHIPTQLLAAAHQTSGKFRREQSEFDIAGLTPLTTAAGPAPYVAEASVSMLLEFEEEHHIAANDTVLVVGRVRQLRVPQEATFASLADQTAPASLPWQQLEGAVVSGLYSYYTVAPESTRAYVEVEHADQ